MNPILKGFLDRLRATRSFRESGRWLDEQLANRAVEQPQQSEYPVQGSNPHT